MDFEVLLRRLKVALASRRWEDSAIAVLVAFRADCRSVRYLKSKKLSLNPRLGRVLWWFTAFELILCFVTSLPAVNLQ